MIALDVKVESFQERIEWYWSEGTSPCWGQSNAACGSQDQLQRVETHTGKSKSFNNSLAGHSHPSWDGLKVAHMAGF